MKVAIIGSRSLIDIDIEKYVPENTDTIISGGAKGIDSLAQEYAELHNIPTIIFEPEYRKYGKIAPIIRDKQIVQAADIVIAIWDGKSKGTRFTLEYANKIGKRTFTYRIWNSGQIFNLSAIFKGIR